MSGNKKLAIGIIVLVLAAVILALCLVRKQESIDRVEGIVVDVVPSVKMITLIEAGRGGKLYLTLTDDTELFDKDRHLVDLSYFRMGFVVEAIGKMNGRHSLIPSEIYIEQEMENSCLVCINGCNECPEGCEECSTGIGKEILDQNLKWYYGLGDDLKLNEITVPIFTDYKPDTILNSLLQALNDSCLGIEFLNPVSSYQWWISDDGWSITDPNAVSITSLTSTFKDERRFSAGLLNPLANELNHLISNIFLDNGFALNVTNTSESEEEFYDYVVAFQKGETRCILMTDGDIGKYSVACSDRFLEAYKEQIAYVKLLNNQNIVVGVRARIGDFVWLNVHARRTGYMVLVKDKPGEKMKVIFTGQESPPCDLMIENQVPKEVYGACYDASGNIVE